MRQLTASELKDYLETANASPLLLDVRESWEYQLCNIDGSHHLPMSNIRNELDHLDPDRETIVICHHGVRSYHVARFLLEMEFNEVINLAGGINAWAREVDPGMTVY